MSAVRVQRRRTAGWRMPEGAVYVGRGSQYGNPYRVLDRDTAVSGNAYFSPEDAVKHFKWFVDYINSKLHTFPESPLLHKNIQAKLRGKTLACWCADGQPCHADVLLEIANKEAQ